MIVGGCDVGSLSAEAVLMEDERIISSEIIRVRPRPEESASDVMGKVLSKVSLTLENIEYCVSTGYGRERIPFAKDNISEISCHSKGAHWLIPSVRTIIDVGGQDCKGIRVNERGELLDFCMNDKCAAGTGRFLEVMAKVLGLGIEELGPRSLHSRSPVTITSMCSVFAESEVMRSLDDGEDLADILAGINHAMALRVKLLVGRIGVEKDVCITGGVAKNIGVTKNLEEMLGVETKKFTVDPQIIGALGAALFARERLNK